jgi:hypothetical protein
MKRLGRTGVLIAFFAALLGAPSAVLGAAPNALSSAAVSPTSGSTSTLFVFTVRYVSKAGNAATGVSVTVAGRTLPMSRISGTATDGTFRAAGTLPAGSWPTTFSARAAHGPQPSLAGPNVTVVAPATPAPTRYSAPLPTAAPGSPTLLPAENTAPTPAPVTKSQPSSDPAVANAAPDPTSVPQPVSAPEPAVATPGVEKPSGSSPSALPAPAAAGATATPAPPATVASPAGSRSSAAPASTAPLLPGGQSPWSLLAIVLFGIAALAITGIASLLVIDRRRHEDEDPLVVGEGTFVRRGHLASDDLSLADTIAERAVRRSRLDPSDDPIVAAMGLPRPSDKRRRFDAGQVSSGPGERPTTRISRRRDR